MKITDNFSCRHCWDNHITVEFVTLPKDWTRVKCDHCGKYTWVKYFDNDAAHRVLTSCKRPPKIHLYNSACWHNTVITVSNPLLVDCKH